MKTLVAAMGLSAISACATAVRTTNDERASVEAVLRAYEAAYNARDAAALARVHAEDGGYYMPSGEPVVGREALERFWSRARGAGSRWSSSASRRRARSRGRSDAGRPATQLSRAGADASCSRCAATRPVRSRSSST